MPRPPSKIQLALPRIAGTFDDLPTRVFTARELGQLLAKHRSAWRLSDSTGLPSFIVFLIDMAKLEKHVLEFPKEHHTIYTWGAVSPWEFAPALGRNAYVSHFSAAFLHGMTEQVPKSVYVTVPQPRKGDVPVVSQQDIDTAFARPERVSSSIAMLGSYRVVRLSGMDTGGQGITDLNLPQGGRTRVTTIERTLIDATVRPSYAGGPAHVIDVFRLAKKQGASTNRLVALLKAIPFAYPYHQAIGFYLERAGYSAAALDLVRRLGLHYDFYLAHGMRDPQYSVAWRLHFPKDL